MNTLGTVTFTKKENREERKRSRGGGGERWSGNDRDSPHGDRKERERERDDPTPKVMMSEEGGGDSVPKKTKHKQTPTNEEKRRRKIFLSRLNLWTRRHDGDGRTDGLLERHGRHGRRRVPSSSLVVVTAAAVVLMVVVVVVVVAVAVVGTSSVLRVDRVVHRAGKLSRSRRRVLVRRVQPVQHTLLLPPRDENREASERESEEREHTIVRERRAYHEF